MYLHALLGISFVQTPAEARITAQNPQGYGWAMPYIDVQLMSLDTWPFKIAGYNTQMGANDLPGLALTAIACGSMENTYKQLSRGLDSGPSETYFCPTHVASRTSATGSDLIKRCVTWQNLGT